MEINIFNELLAEIPTLRHYFIACEEVAVTAMRKTLPRAQRGKQKGNLKRRWRKYINRVVETAREKSVEEAIGLVQNPIAPGIAYASTTDEANEILHEFSKAGRCVAVYEEILSEEAVIVHLYDH